MDSAFSPLGFLIFGISISLYAIIAQSQTQNGNNGAEFAPPTFWVSGPPPPPPPPPPSPPPPPPSRVKPPPPPSQHEEISASPLGSPRLRGRHRHRKPPPLPPPPPPPSNQMNAGKKVGLLFVGIAAIMQVGMVGFLVFKRRQLLRSDDRYESCS